MCRQFEGSLSSRDTSSCVSVRGPLAGLLISGSKVRVLNGPPIESGTSDTAECPIWLFGSVWFQIWFQIGPETAFGRRRHRARDTVEQVHPPPPLFGIQPGYYLSVVDGLTCPSCALT